MKKLLTFLLVAALILSMGTTVFAIKGGDGELNEIKVFDFGNSASATALLGSERFGTTSSVDTSICAQGSSCSLKLNPSTSHIATGSILSSWGNIETDWSQYDNMKIKLYVSERNTQTNFANNYIRLLFGPNAYYNMQPEDGTKVYFRYNIDVSALSVGWNEVTISFSDIQTVIGSGQDSNSFDYWKSTYGSNIECFRINHGTESVTASGNSPFPYTLNIDSISLTKNTTAYSYDVASDSTVLWEFNSEDAITNNVSYTSTTLAKLSADKTIVNAYDVSATFTTSTAKKCLPLSLSSVPDTSSTETVSDLIKKTDSESGEYLYDYLNILVGNPNGTDVTIGCQIHFSGTAQVTLPKGWSVVSIPIDGKLTSGITSANSYHRSKISLATLKISENAGGANSTTDGIKYNFDMIWLSKAPAASGDAVNGYYVSQTPLTCTDAVINSDGTASCKITNWPGERFVVIFATYNADGSLNSVDCVKDYDGGENKETVVNSSKALTIPEGGTTKVMVWNGFGEIAPMTTVK